MLNPTFTVLLPFITLILGGTLTLLTSYILQRTGNSIDNKKFIRQNVEEVYTALNRIQKHFYDFHQNILNASSDKTKLEITPQEEYREIEPEIEKMRTLINLYLPTLKNEFEKYTQTILLIRTYQFKYLDRILGKPYLSRGGMIDPFIDYSEARELFSKEHTHLQSRLEKLAR